MITTTRINLGLPQNPLSRYSHINAPFQQAQESRHIKKHIKLGNRKTNFSIFNTNHGSMKTHINKVAKRIKIYREGKES